MSVALGLEFFGILSLSVPFVYSTIDMLSTYSFMFPLLFLGIPPWQREAQPVCKRLVRWLGVERGLLAYWFAEVAFLLVLYLASSVGPLFSPIHYAFLAALDLAALIGCLTYLKRNFKRGSELRTQLQGRIS